MAEFRFTFIDILELHKRVLASVHGSRSTAEDLAHRLLVEGVCAEEEARGTVTAYMQQLSPSALVTRVCQLLRAQYSVTLARRPSLGKTCKDGRLHVEVDQLWTNFWSFNQELYENSTADVARLMDSWRPSDDEFRHWCCAHVEDRYLHYKFHSGRDPWVRHLGSNSPRPKCQTNHCTGMIAQ